VVDGDKAVREKWDPFHRRVRDVPFSTAASCSKGWRGQWAAYETRQGGGPTICSEADSGVRLLRHSPRSLLALGQNGFLHFANSVFWKTGRILEGEFIPGDAAAIASGRPSKLGVTIPR